MVQPPVGARVRWKDPRKLKGAVGLVTRHYPLPFGCESGCTEHFWVEWQGTALQGGFCPIKAWDQLQLEP
ncbi:MAG: hypothetical protein HY685_04900 [Chloroflexi bacterium]|nr:hypothetical protein [Chloroflexota bacterium]